ncbi:MAG: 16S rRNA (cytidine(1402)-2'-O)-methyltransferase [Coriobacteriales bacterium]|jgi:16S rRNA (cytidine1402-2'-O)-methyltransferase
MTMDDAMRGGLTLVGTPIGNLGDLSPRARDALAAADVVLAEDTRVSGRLLAACGIRGARLERCDENVIAARAQGLVERMLAGEGMAFVSDAGMPAVADPGARLVDACLDAGVPVDVVPGPSAVTCALAQAGFACESFYFGGFLPRRDAARDRLLESLAALPAALVFYESPHRSADSLDAIARVLPARRVALARELTKMHQEVLRAPAAELAAAVRAREGLRGEVAIVVDAPSREELEAARSRLRDGAAFDLDDAIRRGLEAGTPKSALARDLAARCGMTRGKVYERILELAR